MKIAVDKNTLNAVDSDNEYIYLFDNESYQQLKQLNMHCLYYKLCETVDINLTDYDIPCFKKANIKDPEWKSLQQCKQNKIGIIIPNYNYQHTVTKCINSILSQTYKNYQIIFVDDVSDDDSVEVAKQLLKPPHKVIQLKQKRYNGGARNEGLLHLDEDVDYVFFVDSDDWLIDDQVLYKINFKLQNNCDVLFIGLTAYKNGQVLKTIEVDYKTKYDALNGWSGCGKIIKKSLISKQQCLYNEGTLKEDKNQHCKLCINMNSFECLNEPLYVYNRDNNKSITNVRDQILWKTSTIRHYADTLQLQLSEKGKDEKVDQFLQQRVELTKKEMQEGGDRQW